MIDVCKKLSLRLFRIHEYENQPILGLVLWIVFTSYLFTFFNWINEANLSIENFVSGKTVCPTYFQTCYEYLFLHSYPGGYGTNILFLGLFLLILIGFLSLYEKKWLRASYILLTLTIFKIINIYAFNHGIQGNFDMYDIILSLVILFSREKLYFLKVYFVWFYFLSSTVKFDEAWIYGDYFNTLNLGLPFIPDSLIPVFTNIVIWMQIVLAWFLLSKNKFLQRLSFVLFIFFHIYSGILIQYRFIVLTVPMVFVLFSGYFDSNKNFKILSINKETFFSYLGLLLLLCGQLVPVLIPGNHKITLEGNYFGFFVFEAAHQCISQYSLVNKNGTTTKHEDRKFVSGHRCDPYAYWFKIKEKCLADDTVSISWNFFHSINGQKYVKIVDSLDICSSSYKTLSHNSWINENNKDNTDNMPVYKLNQITDFPKDFKMVSIAPISLDIGLENKKEAYWLLWVFVLLFLIYKLFKINS